MKCFENLNNKAGTTSRANMGYVVYLLDLSAFLCWKGKCFVKMLLQNETLPLAVDLDGNFI